MHIDGKTLYYKSLELILEGEYESSLKLLKRSARAGSFDMKTEVLLTLFRLRQECIREISVAE